MLLVDAANVIGSRPQGGGGIERERQDLRDQGPAAAASGRIDQPVVVVLEGQSRQGAPTGVADGVTVIHAEGSGDDALVDCRGRSSPTTPSPS